jgi:hypothetical protein
MIIIKFLAITIVLGLMESSLMKSFANSKYKKTIGADKVVNPNIPIIQRFGFGLEGIGGKDGLFSAPRCRKSGIGEPGPFLASGGAKDDGRGGGRGGSLARRGEGRASVRGESLAENGGGGSFAGAGPISAAISAISLLNNGADSVASTS